MGVLVNGLIETVETVSVALEPAAQARDDAEAAFGSPARAVVRSARSRSPMKEYTDHYLTPPGQGITSVVSAVAPDVDRSIKSALSAAHAAVSAIPIGPDQRDRLLGPELLRAAEACRALEKVLKSGLLSALGVTLTVRSADGD